MKKIRMGVSRCLMGDKVRYDGQGKRDRYLTDQLNAYFEYVPVCPEFELGLGVPRESMRLEGDPVAPRLVTHKLRTDLTDSMNDWCTKRIAELEQEQLGGFIFKSKSPSSGLHRVKIYQPSGPPRMGRGLFADALTKAFPLLPVEEEGRLHDAVLRECFINQVFTLARWRTMLAEKRTVAGLIDFHAQHKYFFMAHSVSALKGLGQLVAHATPENLEATLTDYWAMAMQVLRQPSSVAQQVNVLQHMAGYFKKQLDADERAELQALIRNYQQELVPVLVPITLMNHYIRKYGVDYLAQQIYLQPHPFELKLRNGI